MEVPRTGGTFDRMRRSLLLGFVALALVLVACTDDEPAAAPGRTDGVELIGDDLGDLVLTGLDGGPAIDLRDFRGTPVVINFFASTCAPCVREMPDLEAAHQRYGDDVVFVGVAVNDRVADTLELVEQTGITYALASDPRGELFLEQSGASALPATMVLDADGEVAVRITKVIEGDELTDALAEVGVT